MKIKMICLFGVLSFLFACGGETQEKQVEGPGSDEEFANVIEPILADSCALSGCHATAGFVKSGAAFKASSSLSRIQSGNMPKPGPGLDAFSSADKAKVLAYLGG